MTEMKTRRKYSLDPHHPRKPLDLALPKSRQLAETIARLRNTRESLRESLSGLPDSIQIHLRKCRRGCAACPHVQFSHAGKPGLAGVRALAAIARKHRQFRELQRIERTFSRLCEMAEQAINQMGMPRMPAAGPYAPLPFHVFAWQAIPLNRQVLAMQRALVEWNTANNRARKNKITRQGALGFRIRHLQSGLFQPRWAIWVRGDRGQWIGAKTARPTYRTSIARPDRVLQIPVRLTVTVINRTGNHDHKDAYLQWESRRHALVREIARQSRHSHKLARIQQACDRLSVR